MMYLAAIVSISLVAKTFGSYASALLAGDPPGWAPAVFAVGVVVALVALNLRGSRSVARVELVIVVFKFVVLLTLTIGCLFVLDPGLLSLDDSPGPGSVLASVALTFFAYEGFRVVTNAAEDVERPERTIPRAILTAILLVMGLYVLVSLAVFGTLSTDEVIAARENALAEAARPVFGSFGFVAISVTALVATASAINASLYAVTNATYRMAKDGELPGVFGEPISHSREGLLISGFAIAVLAVSFDLSDIAVLGAVTILLVHSAVHIGHLRLTAQTGARRSVVAAAAAISLVAMVVSLVDAARTSWTVALAFGGFVALAVVVELVLRRYHRAGLTARTS
jgi:amino acid transporter